MDSVTTRYGTFRVQGGLERHPDGSPRALIPCAGAVAATPLGALVPRHSATDERRKTGPSLEWYPDGALRSIILEDRSRVATPAGPVLAEQILFYPDGSVKRVFPLCGRTSAYWTQEDEARLMEPFAAKTPLGGVTARFMSLAFDQRGGMRSLTLWPGEIVDLSTPAGRLPVRIGAAFFPDGAVRSVEPGRPVAVDTPVGRVLAYDPDAAGVTGDVNSLRFDPAGRVVRVAALRTMLSVRDRERGVIEIRPAVRESLCGNADTEPVAMILCFEPGRVTVRRAPGEAALSCRLDGVNGDDAARAAILPPQGLFAAPEGAACHGAPTAF